MKQAGTRSDRAVKMTLLIEILGPVLERHVDNDDIDAYVVSLETVPLDGGGRTTRQMVPDLAARLKALAGTTDDPVMRESAWFLFDCRVDWAHQIPISAERLAEAFDAATDLCRALDELSTIPAIEAVRNQPATSHWQEETERLARERSVLKRRAAQWERERSSLLALFDRMIVVVERRANYRLRSLLETQRRAAGPGKRMAA